MVSEQVVKIIARVAKHLNHDAIKFDEAAASKRINESKDLIMAKGKSALAWR